MIGDENFVVDSIFGNIIVDGGLGNDLLMIRDEGNLNSKSVAVHSTIISGVHGSEDDNIYYYKFETTDISLGTADMQVDVYSTAKNSLLILTTQGKMLIFDKHVCKREKMILWCFKYLLMSLSISCLLVIWNIMIGSFVLAFGMRNGFPQNQHQIF